MQASSQFTNNPTIDNLERIAGRLLVFLAAASFVLSYYGMYAVARDAGYGWLSFLWPLVTETAVVIFSLVYLIAKLRGYDNRLLMPLIVACTALSVLFNVWHAPDDTWLTRSVVALPPVFLFAAFKTWIWRIEQDTRRAGVVIELDRVTDDLARKRRSLSDIDNELADRRQALASLPAQTGPQPVTDGQMSAANDARQDSIEARRERVLAMLRQGLDKGDIADRLDVSTRTIGRDIKALNGRAS